MATVFHLVLIGWIPLVFLLFRSYPGRKACVATFIVGFFFLPQGGYDVPLLPDLDRVTLTSLGALLAAMTFDLRTVSRFRIRWYDVPILIFTLAPFLSSVINGLGAYDGVASVLKQFMWWGVPYFLGRVYLSDPDGLWDLSRAFLIAIVIYIPLALLEIRMSPKVHLWVYGHWTRGGGQRGGRSFFGFGAAFIVFFDIAINATVIMATGGIILLWMKLTGMLKRLAGVPTAVLGTLAVALAVWSKVFSPIATLVFGFLCLLPIRVLKTRIALLSLALAVPLYAGARVAGWEAEEIISVTGKVADTYTLEARIRNASYVIENAKRRPILGWGPWASRFRTEQVEAIDGMWVNVFGSFGIVGLVGFFGTMLLPVVLFLLRAPRTDLLHYGEVAGLAWCFAITAFMAHALFNAMLAPPMVFAAGGLAGAWARFRLPSPMYHDSVPRAGMREMPTGGFGGRIPHIADRDDEE